LIEATTAMCVIAVFITGIYAANARVWSLLRASLESNSASRVLNGRAEQIRAGTWSQITTAAFHSGTVFNIPSDSAGELGALVETVNIIAYPTPSPNPAQIRLTRDNTSGVITTVGAGDGTMPTQTSIRIDLTANWTAKGGKHHRKTLKSIHTLRRGQRAFTLLELLIAVTISAVMFAAIIGAGTTSVRSLATADDYSYQSNEELRAMDFIARDLRRALWVGIPTGGLTLNLTLPDYYSAYDAQGNPTGNPVTPTIVSGTPAYGNPATPIAVSYAVTGGRLLRTQTIQATGAVNSLVICSNVTDFQLSFVALSTTVKFSITFDPKYQPVSAALNAGTRLSGTVAVRALRFQ
jgi:prepilin-type N-terminal cleavage/methylation domain-containing protein